MRRKNIREILDTPAKRRTIMVWMIRAIQAREGIDCSVENAQLAYDKIFGDGG